MTDLHDEIRSRLRRRQGRARIVGDLLKDGNYSHITPALLAEAIDEVQDEPPEPTPATEGILITPHSTSEELGHAAADHLIREREPVVVQGALRWTRPEYSTPITDTGALPWRGAWQRVPWHDGKRVVRRGPPCDGVALEAVMSRAPVVRAGGAAWTRAGWVSSRGVVGDYYCTEDVRDVLIDDDPGDHLWELFRDFPLIDADARRRVLAAVLTAVCAPAIDGPMPAFLVCAHNPGDGKTLLAQLISVIADGTEAVVPWHDDEDRTRELLLAALDEPGRVVILDNVRGRLGGSILETILTSTHVVGARKYERARKYRVDKLIIITGNDPRVTPDMARRVVRVQVDRGGALPPADLPEVLAMARQRRPEWLACVRAILDKWDRVKRPIPGCRSYEVWSALIGGVLGDDWTPIDAARVAAEHDPDALAWMPALEALYARQGRSPMSVSEILAATGRSAWEGLLQGRRGTPESQIGAALSAAAGRAIGHYRVVRSVVHVQTQNGMVPRGHYRIDRVDGDVGNMETSEDDDNDNPFNGR